MSITVGAYTFDTRTTVVHEAYEEVGGRQTRAIRITGLLRGAPDEAALIDTLDNITKAVFENAPVMVSIRPCRRFQARREAFSRELNGRTITGQFTLDLRAETAWEESTTLHESEWIIGMSGDELDLENSGNDNACPIITLTAEDFLITPAISDGTRTLTYEGNVASGETLIIDGENRVVTLDGADVTGYTTGDFPQLAPGDTTLTYIDDPGSSHLVSANVAHRDRWW